MADTPRPGGGPRQAAPEALHPGVASALTALLRNEYVTRGIPAEPDAVLIEIVGEVFLTLVRGRAEARSGQTSVKRAAR